MPLFYAAPAHADDVLDAQNALDAGNALVVDLTLQDNQAVAVVTSAEQEVISAQATVDATDITVTQATQVVADAQLAYDTNLITQITHTGDGLTATVYNDRGYNNAPLLGAGVIDHVQPVAQINFQWGSGSVLNGPSEDVQIKFTGDLTAPSTGNYQFYGPADDGFILKINGNTIINDWRDKGGGGSVSQPVFLTANQPNSLEAWYYENGGGAWVQLNWNSGNGWQVIPVTAFETNTVIQTKNPNLLLVLNDAQSAYDNAMLNKSIALDNLDSAIALYNAALEAKGITYNNLQTALSAIPMLQDALTNITEVKRLADEQAAIAAAKAAAQAEADRLAAIEAQKPVIIDPIPTKEPVVPTPEPTVDSQPTTAPTTEPTPTPSETTQSTQESTTPIVQPSPTPEPLPTPEVQPEPKLPVTESAAVEAISNLVDVAPEDLSNKQVTALVAAANVVFETAQQGSPAYEQALQALAIAAQADDLQLPAELASVPGAAAVLATFNALGNVGADMAPVVREEAQKTVIASVIAAGAAVNAATGAAMGATSVSAATTTSSTPSSSSTGSGSSSGGSSGGSGEASESNSKTTSRRREIK